MINKRYLDRDANRYSFIEDPQKIKISGTKEDTIKMPLHPEEKRGFRKLKINKEFYIQKSDKPKKDKIYRFMHLFNFKNNKFISEEYDQSFKAKLIHWLPVSEENIKVDIIMNDNKITEGLAEKTIKKVKIGELIQFERFGFCRLDKKTKNKYIFYFTHK